MLALLLAGPGEEGLGRHRYTVEPIRG
jgi:hypothetical protein